MSEKPLFGCIEAGGTKFVLGVLASKDEILETTRIPTGSPEEAIGPAVEFFSQAAKRFGTLSAFGIAQQSMLSPRRIILGGGVMATTGLIERVRAETLRLSADYFPLDPVEDLIQPPALAERSGLLGALALAQGAV